MASLLQKVSFRRDYRDTEYLFQFHSGVVEKKIERYFYRILLNGLVQEFHNPELLTASGLKAKSDQWSSREFKMRIKSGSPDLESIRYCTALSGARGLFYRKRSHYDNGMRSVFVRYSSVINEVRKGEGSADERRQYMDVSVVNQGEETIVEVATPHALEYVGIQKKFRKHFSELPRFLQGYGKSLLEVAKTVPVKDSARQHEVVQYSLMRNCPSVVACEVPVSGTFDGSSMTTFIDVLARDFRSAGGQDKYYILDYKPNALSDKHVSAQLFCCLSLFCECTGIDSENVSLGWFDESHVFLL